jgi:hypothetical protein
VTERFWGHPDDWPEDEWQEYLAERAVRREQEQAPPPYAPKREDVRRIYANHYITEKDRVLGGEEFDRWLASELTDAYFRGAESMCDQNAEDHFDGANVPQFVSLYEDGVEYTDWQARNGSR